MNHNTNFYLNIYLSITLLVQVANLILTIVYLRSKYKKYEFTDKIKNAKDIVHTIFNFMLIILIIFLFNPFFQGRIEINNTVKTFLFTFGIMSLITLIQSLISN